MRFIGTAVLLFSLALSAHAEKPLREAIQGRWKFDVASMADGLRKEAEANGLDAAQRQKLEETISTVLPLLTVEITADTLMGLNGTQPYVVKSVDEKQIILHVSAPVAGDLVFELLDRDRLRMAGPEDPSVAILLNRDMAYAARLAMPRPTAAECQGWRKRMSGTWKVDMGTPLLESMRRSEAYQKASVAERSREEALWKALNAEAEPDLVEFTTDSMRGVAAPGKSSSRQPMSYELVAIDGKRAWATVVESNGVRDEWLFEEQADGSVRVFSHDAAMFDLRRPRGER
jgi:hypothetical protein